MARVTVEDCLEHMDNRFELVLVGAKRARQLYRGEEPMVSWDRDKPTVVALREIAKGLIDAEKLAEIEAAKTAIEDPFRRDDDVENAPPANEKVDDEDAG